MCTLDLLIRDDHDDHGDHDDHDDHDADNIK